MQRLYCYGVAEGGAEMIKLNTIDLKDVTLTEQINKVMEEHNEFIAAILKNDVENAKEEFCDYVTAAAGLLEKNNVATDEIESYYNNEHYEKLKSRGNKPRERMSFEKYCGGITRCNDCPLCEFADTEEQCENMYYKLLNRGGKAEIKLF